jgi:integrase
MRVALTDRLVAGSKGVAGRQQEYFDTKAVGLALRVSPAGTRTWTHGTDAAGRRCRVKLGSYPAMPLAAARTAALQARAAAEAGNDPRVRSDAMTVSALVDSYITKRVRSALRNSYQVTRRLRKNVTPVIGSVRLADLHRRDVNRVIDAILARDCPAEANSVFADLRAMLRWAMRRGDIDHDPTVGMAMPAPARFRERALSEPEIAELWKSLPITLADSVDAQHILRLCLITGQRIGEVTGITGAEIDLASREWRLPASRSKNKHPHTIPLSDLALTTISEALADARGQKLFAITPNEVARRVKDAQGAIGIASWTPHDLRRSALTQMAKLGVEPIVIGHVANHRTTTKAGVTLAIYVKHSYESEKRRALDLWADRLQAIISGKATAEVIPLGEHSR